MKMEPIIHTLTIARDDRIKNMLEQSDIKVTFESSNMVLPHNLQTTLFLRSEGYDVAAPVLSQYDFPSPSGKKAFETQRQTVAMMTTEPKDYVLNGIGTGKTRCVLWAYSFLKRERLANKLIVFAPISTLIRTWAREIMMHFPDLTYAVVYGERAKRSKELAKNVDVYIINHDGYLVLEDELLLRPDIDCIAIDELAFFRNGGANRTKHLAAFVRQRYWAWGLTGSPTPKSVTDIWGQCQIVTPWTVPKYFSHLRTDLQYKNGPFKWKNRDGAEERAVSMMRPSIRFTLDDVVELPPKVLQFVEAPLSKQQKRIYDAMRTKSMVLIKGKKIDALNAGAVLSKLLQIALGYVYTREGQVVTLDNKHRVQTIVDFVDGCDRKVLVFMPFKSALAGYSLAFAANDIDHCVISGDTPMGMRTQYFNDFQDTDRYKVILCHPACLAHGLTLTAASTCIWGGPVTSLDTFIQANGRITRVSQEYKQLIAMVGGTKAEKRIYDLLGNNERVQDRFLELVEEITNS